MPGVILNSYFEYPIKYKETSIYGLKSEPSLGPLISDSLDYISNFSYRPALEISNREIDALSKIINTSMKFIMEIGVYKAENKTQSFTHLFCANKSDDCHYLGIDIMDKSYLNNADKNIFILQSDSKEQEKIRHFITENIKKPIDLLFIDGDHSVNSVINDWKYADLLADGGYVVMHDTNIHPGPYCILECINEALFDISVLFRECHDDYGLSIIKKRSRYQMELQYSK